MVLQIYISQSAVAALVVFTTNYCKGCNVRSLHKHISLIKATLFAHKQFDPFAPLTYMARFSEPIIQEKP
jgi:hypothetical protein